MGIAGFHYSDSVTGSEVKRRNKRWMKRKIYYTTVME
jgi:hypothetical protein